MRICTICARGGSQGVPGKNIRMIGGLPLIAHTIQSALASDLFDVVAVDSDSNKILDVASEYGATVTLKRPDHLATATAGKLEVIARAIKETEEITGERYTTLVDLDATAPLRDIADIDAAVALVEGGEADNVISVAPSHRSPYFNLVEKTSEGFVTLSKPSLVVRRQDSPECFDMNASIYVWRRSPFVEAPYLFGPRTKAYVMPRERSVDIDEELDFKIVSMLLDEKQNSSRDTADREFRKAQ